MSAFIDSGHDEGAASTQAYVRSVYGLLRSHKQVFDQTKDAYVYSAFWWRRYLLALNVCAPRCLFVLAAC
jgi:hypothetical protein